MPGSPWAQLPVNRVIRAGTAVFSNASPPQDLIELVDRIAPRATFLIYASHVDNRDEKRFSRAYYREAGERKAIWGVPEAGHVGAQYARPREYEQRVTRFFYQALRKGTAMNSFTAQRRIFSRRELAFLIGIPVAWGILLLFHPTGDADGFYEVIDGNITVWLTVHIGMGVFVPLFAGVIYLLLRGVDSTAAKISRIGLAVFAVVYAAWELLLGAGTGVLTDEVNAMPEPQQAAGRDLVESYAENGVLSVLSVLGSLGLGVAMIAAAVALRAAYRLGWVSLALMVVSLPLIAVHEPPYGPVGLTTFIVAVLLFVREQATAPAPGGRPLSPPVSAPTA